MSTTATVYEYECPHCGETYDVSRDDLILDGCCGGGAFDIHGAVQLPDVPRLSEMCDEPPYDAQQFDAQILEDHARVFGVR